MTTTSPVRPDGRLRQARYGVIAFFMLHGLLFASWIVRIPDVKAQLKLSDWELGLALLGAPIGAVAGQFLVGWLLGKYGSKAITVAMALIWCLLFPLLGLVPNMIALMGGLFVYGLLSGGFDVAMNAQAALVEKLYGRPIMASFHGMWNIASLIAAAVGGFLAGLRVPVALHFLGAALFVMVGVLLAQRTLLAEERPAAGESQSHSFSLLPRSLIVLGVLAFCVLLIEGAIGDWSAVYLRETLGSPAVEAASAYVVCNLLMTVGRLTGDYLTLRLGPALIVRGGGVLALAGLVIFLVSPWPLVSVAACALIGAGIACPYPLVISAAARTTEIAPGRAISAMATVGFSGTLLGPPLIGAIAELFSLRGALSLLALAALTLIIFGNQVQSRESAAVAAEV